MVPISKATRALQKSMVRADIIHESALGDADLAFMAELPPLGLATVSIEFGSPDAAGVAAHSTVSHKCAPGSGC